MTAADVPPSPRQPVRGTFVRNSLTSTFTIALDFFTLTGLVELVGVDYVLATWIATIVGSLSNFSINRWWTFRVSWQPRSMQFLRFVLVQVGASGLHTVGVWLLTRFLGLPYPASKLVVAALVYLGWNYPMNRWVVFSPRFSGPGQPIHLPGA
ncbi:MAG: GtrA family protein [Polyangia bacterium]